jgi:hypothetical protein
MHVTLRSLTRRMRGGVILTAAFVVVATVAVGPAQADSAHRGDGGRPKPSATSPAVSGPVTGGKGAVVLGATTFDLSTVGYQQSEFFLSGNATSYQPVGSLDSSGVWKVTPAGSKPYTTRIVVNRPVDPRAFNGTVVVEWLNVSAGLDAAPDWIGAHNELIRDGFAWVGVSAQAAGVMATKAADPVRYATLSHPGDSYSYDIFSQAGQAVWDSSAQVLGGLHPHTVLADGESQSAFRLTTYADAVQPLVNVYDGLLIHSRSGGGSALSQAPEAAVPAPSVVFIRSDLRVPVLTFETETDLLGLGFLPARQDDSSRFRLWEVAGTAHADTYNLGIGFPDTGIGHGGIDLFDSMLNPPATPLPGFTCASPINSGEQHYVLDTAVYALNQWVTRGQAPARAPRLQINTTAPASFVLDGHGNVKGGIRTPAVDVPVAALSGLGQSGSSFCSLFGTTVPFNAATLAALYPTHAKFVAQWAGDSRHGVAAGFIRPADADELVASALVSSVGR